MASDAFSLIPLLAVLLPAAAAAVVVLAVVLVKKAGRKKDALLMQAFGCPPGDTDYEIGNIASYHKYASALPSGSRIDATTWNDLSMDDIFRRVNTCSSDVGEEYLYHILHELDESDHNGKQEQLICWLGNHPQERLALFKILRGLGRRSTGRLSYYLFHADAERIGHSWLFLLLAALPLAGFCLMPFFLPAGVIFTICSAAVNIIIYYYNRLELETGLESMRCFSSMLWAAKKIEKRFGPVFAQFGYDLEGALRPFRHTGGLVSGSTQQNLAELEAFSILLKSIFLTDLISYDRTIEKVLAHPEEFSLLYRIIGQIDVSMSILSFRESLPCWCRPSFTAHSGISFRGMYHPLLRHPVTNDGAIGNDCIITGSNASGKSTFIKALAVNNILAQTIGTCCAKEYTLRPCYVATSMALRDDIVSGDSYFVTEVKSLKRILDDCRERYCTVFIDEILRGTNTPERIAASTAVLRALHRTGSLCIAASHDIELTEILKETFDLYHFCETMEGNRITFDYQLKPGPSTTTNAVRLLEYMGFDPEIIREANGLLGKD